MRLSTYRKKFPKNKPPNKWTERIDCCTGFTNASGADYIFNGPFNYADYHAAPSPLGDTRQPFTEEFTQHSVRNFITREMERILNGLQYELHLLLVGTPITREMARIVREKIFQAMSPLQENLVHIGLSRGSEIIAETERDWSLNYNRYKIFVRLRVKLPFSVESETFNMQMVLS